MPICFDNLFNLWPLEITDVNNAMTSGKGDCKAYYINNLALLDAIMFNFLVFLCLF